MITHSTYNLSSLMLCVKSNRWREDFAQQPTAGGQASCF